MRHPFFAVVAGSLGILVAGGLSTGAAQAFEINGPFRASIVVRTYTQPAADADMRAARRTAGTILEHAGIEVAWLECATPADIAAASAACSEPLRWNELVVRILPAGTAGSRDEPSTLGFAFVDLDAGGGSLATVYADRVGRMAQLAAVDAGELLGRALAHEIGHLLLGTNGHGSHGLMRAAWSGAQLRRNLRTQWLFDGGEAEMMRRGIAGRRVKG